MQTLKNKEVKNQGNWNSFFPNTNKEQLESNNWRQNNFSQSQNWNGECSYVEINQISIPIPSFVSHATKNKLIQAIQEVQQQVDSHPTVSSFKQKFLGKMHTDFLNKNQELFKKINTSLNINKVVDLNPSLQLHIDNQNKLFQQNLNLKKQDDDAKSDSSAIENLIQRYEVINKDFSPLKAEEFKQFVKNIFDKNNEQSNLVFNDIQQYMKKKETKNKLNNNKNPYLLNLEWIDAKSRKIRTKQQCLKLLKLISQKGKL
ncbi:hypothetical protein TTHERM_000391477 (macronuclear) [Tetrahymena thermophila SB210]|uniref:Uncharacterized protein n=1 Tax=Tetrahymena thermophila (strain SB210) TaxID=312017 RepID=W7XF96_TETTS|nr:hypothetical protein TTHERM_000391477 [Tetrahymena thermophila SB210]EWS75498.1 hypothetical protein TTHERM_000391477 [Tetrahymena thermophila SB210]|eukprot:XP_012651967.1 hypothetical protein TTHERM_000391477 [Tetrahymena thermophila SB210]